MHENLPELFAEAARRTVTIRTKDGHPVVRAKLLHAAAAAAAGVVVAPRLTAAVVLGSLLKGMTLSVDEAPDPV